MFGNSRSTLKITVAFGLFFGSGFASGFISGYKYASSNLACELPPMPYETQREASPDLRGPEGTGTSEVFGNATATTENIGLILEDHWMDSDENGLFIAGAVKNADTGGFDAVRVAFDLLDERESVYTAVTAINDETMEPGSSWDFTIYIPYSEMDRLKSYRLQSIMGVKK
jgi:hypothetical protein